MTAVRIMIGGREYDVACDDGQENHLKNLARTLGEQVRGIAVAAGKNVSESHILVLAALTLTDALQDQNRELLQLRQDIHYSSQSFEKNKQIELESAVAVTIEDIAGRIEAIAGQLEKM